MKKHIITLAFIIIPLLSVSAQSSFLKPTNDPQFTPYISTVNLDLYRELLMSKQNNYDRNIHKNYEAIQELLDDSYEYIQELYELNPQKGIDMNNRVGEYVNSLSDPSVDITDNTQFFFIKSTIKTFIKKTKKAIKAEY